MQDQKKDRSTGSTGSTTGGTKEETAPAGKQGQHWRGEPWAKNPKVGGKETPGTETEQGTSGQHWRGEDMPLERGRETGTERKQQTGTGSESSAVTSDRPDEC